VSYGQSSGPVPPFDLSVLSKGSYFLTRPVLGEYKKDRNELVMSALEIFENIRAGILRPHITHRIALKDAAEAHRLLESRKTMGSIVLIP
jgi:NADPH2:quinone reductase